MLSRRALGLLLLTMVPYFVYTATHGAANLLRFFPDDAFYYLEPARHFVRFGRPSFDGLHATNGFHPLHFLLVSLVAWPDGKDVQLAATFLLTAAITLFALSCLVRTACSRRSRHVGNLLLLLSLPPGIALFVTNAGMEACTTLCATVCLWRTGAAALGHQLQNQRRNLLFGLVLAAFLLARLDNLIAGSVLVLYVAARLLRPHTAIAARTKFAMAASVFLPPLVLCGGYLILNLATTGHAVPINAFVKLQEPTPLAVSWQSATRGSMAGFILGVAPLCLSLLVLGRGLLDARGQRRLWKTKWAPLMALNAGNILFFVYLVGWASNFHRWYFAFPCAIALIDVACWMSEFERRRHARRSTRGARAALPSRAGFALTAILLLVNLSTCYAFLTWFGNRPASTSYQLLQVAHKLNECVPSSAVVGTYDAGVVGFFSEATVINMDGLCNDFDYFLNYKRPHRLLEYIQRNGITHLLVRDSLMHIDKPSGRGGQERIKFLPDPRVRLAIERECFHHTIPGKFSVHCFALDEN